MTPAEYGEHLAAASPAITTDQAEQAARILATIDDVAA